MNGKSVSRAVLTVLSLSVVFLTSASIWEGTAVIAQPGDLPEVGCYVATNAFPRNTVIDIKNLENEKSVRAIVAGTLDSPGLLASLSGEAASAINVTSSSLARVRLTMPADPVAYSRFTEGLESSGDPDRDPLAAIEASPQKTTVDMPAPESALAAAPVAPVPAAPVETPVAAVAVTAPVPVAAEKVAANNNANKVPPVATPEPAVTETTVTEPVAVAATVTPVPEAVPTAMQAVPEVTPDVAASDVPATVTPEEPVVAEVAAVADTPKAASEGEITPVDEPATADIAETTDGPQATTEKTMATELEPEAVTPTVEATAVPAVASAPVVPAPVSAPEIHLEPAEARPPEPIADNTLPVAAEVAPIVKPRPEAAPVAPVPPVADVAVTVVPVEQPKVLPKGAEVAPIAEKPVAAPLKGTVAIPPASPFKAPLVQDLEKGKYYLQLGAFSKAEIVEATIAKFSGHYPIAIQSSGTADKPVWRLFVGPINQGESGALLVRFKNSGYKDAFIRQGK